MTYHEVGMTSPPPSFFSGVFPVVLVGGGAGFVGSRLCEEFLARKVRVICVDNWQTGLRDNVSHLRGNPNFFLVEADIDKARFDGIARLDYVVHLAGIDAYMNGEDLSIETLQTNSLGTQNLLSLALATRSRFTLVSTIDIFSANISSQTVSNYFGEARALEGWYSHHEAKRFAEALVAEYGTKKGLDVRIVRLGDVYGPRMPLSSGSPLAELFKSFIYSRPLRVFGEAFLYPVYVDDVVWGIVRSVLSGGTRNAIISLAGEYTSFGQVAEAFRAVAPGVAMHYVGQDSLPRDQIPREVLRAGRELISWEPHTTLVEGIASTVLWLSSQKGGSALREEGVGTDARPVVFDQKVPVRREFWPKDVFKKTPLDFGGWGMRFWRYNSLALFLLLAFFGWFLLWPLLELVLGLGDLKLAYSYAKRGDPKAEVWLSASSFWFNQAQGGFGLWRFVPFFSDSSSKYVRRSVVLGGLAQISRQHRVAVVQFHRLISGMFGESPVALTAQSLVLGNNLALMGQQLAFLDAELSTLSEADRTFLEKYLPGNLMGELKRWSSSAFSLAGLVGEAPDILGERSPRKYLLLIQDNTELRPAGGVVVGYGLLTFERGNLRGVEFNEASVADSQLFGQVNPPEPIRKYLGDSTWFLKDALWSPDFPTAAQRASWFIEKELDQKVDGVIALDFEYLKQMLGVFGGVDVPGLGRVTSEGFYKKVVSGPADSRAGVLRIAQALFEKVGEGGVSTVSNMGLVSLEALAQKHLSIYFRQPSALSVLSGAGWSGGFAGVDCSVDQACVADYIYFSEANLGKSQANYFLDRTFSLDVDFDQTQVLHKLTIGYGLRTTSLSYKNYFRLYTPLKADQVTAMFVDQASGKQEEISLDRGQEKGKSFLGGFVELAPGSQGQIVLSWSIPYQDQTEYKLLWQKQPGTFGDSLWVNIAKPGSLLGFVYPAPSLTSKSSISYNTRLVHDLEFNSKWQKQ